jgi:hypothetical protein
VPTHPANKLAEPGGRFRALYLCSWYRAPSKLVVGGKISSRSVGRYLNRYAQYRGCPGGTHVPDARMPRGRAVLTEYLGPFAPPAACLLTSRTGLQGPTWAPKSGVQRPVSEGYVLCCCFLGIYNGDFPVDAVCVRRCASSVRKRLGFPAF